MAEKNGKRKEYNIYDELIFEGEHWEKKYKRKKYDFNNGKLIYEGEYFKEKKCNGTF